MKEIVQDATVPDGTSDVTKTVERRHDDDVTVSHLVGVLSTVHHSQTCVVDTDCTDLRLTDACTPLSAA